MVPFAGWEMPVRYGSELEEHRAVRTAAGLFDVSHMGELIVAGSGALRFLQSVTPNDVSRLAIGQAHYSALLTHDGTFIDDLLVYRLADAEYMLVVNAANRTKALAHLEAQLEQGDDRGSVSIDDRSDEYALLALQGPSAASILGRLTTVSLADLGYYRFVEGAVDGLDALISRTGYTGEDGFELYVRPDAAEPLWRRLLETGGDDGLLPAGLGCRDTLRLEAGMLLSGQDIDSRITPIEAGLSWMVKLKKGPFVGHEVLKAQKRVGVSRRVVGFELSERGIARAGASVTLVHEGESESPPVTGVTSSGTWSPTLEKAIGLARLEGPQPFSEPQTGSVVEVEVRGRALRGVVVQVPFYRRQK